MVASTIVTAVCVFGFLALLIAAGGGTSGGSGA
jgi:hypothetical protein